MPKSDSSPAVSRQPVSLKMLAEYLDLSVATVSFVLNNSPNRSIPEVTRERVRAAAKKFKYQPSVVARSLQGKRTKTVGILLPEIGAGYHSQVLSGAADVFMREGYFFFTVHHRHKQDLVEEYPRLLAARGVEAILAIDTHFTEKPALPTVAVAGHTAIAGVTNVVLDHDRAAELTIGHLFRHGHRKIAYMHGQTFSSDSASRWRSTLRVARAFGLQVPDDLIIRLDRDLNSPELGYPGVQQLLMRRRDFTAVVCFNDVSAIGSVRALHDAGLRVPADISIVGFDDIQSAAFQVPSLTTIRQPLEQMGGQAATMLLKKLAGERTPDVVKIEPELIVRESTGKVPTATQKAAIKK
jgi:DNA-binding LacI/PurR family transcriptional regulator